MHEKSHDLIQNIFHCFTRCRLVRPTNFDDTKWITLISQRCWDWLGQRWPFAIMAEVPMTSVARSRPSGHSQHRISQPYPLTISPLYINLQHWQIKCIISVKNPNECVPPLMWQHSPIWSHAVSSVRLVIANQGWNSHFLTQLVDIWYRFSILQNNA